MRKSVEDDKKYQLSYYYAHKEEIGFYQYQNIIEFMSAIGYPKFKEEYLQLKDIISNNVDILKPTLPKVNPIDLMWQIDEMRGLTK